jgi:cell division septation protein DedD
MRFSYRAAGPIAAAVILTLLTACSRTQRDWGVAQKADTAQAYEVFVDRHPDSELAAVARQRIAELTEQAAWQQATRANTAAAYQDYLTKYPNGSWSQDARIRMESRSLPGSPPQGREASPAAEPAASATSQPGSRDATAGRLAVQLGAFSSVANARTAWEQLSSRFRPELEDLTPQVIPVVSSGRRLYRLEAGVASQAAARQLCRQLQQHAQGCLPLP